MIAPGWNWFWQPWVYHCHSNKMCCFKLSKNKTLLLFYHPANPWVLLFPSPFVPRASCSGDLSLAPKLRRSFTRCQFITGALWTLWAAWVSSLELSGFWFLCSNVIQIRKWIQNCAQVGYSSQLSWLWGPSKVKWWWNSTKWYQLLENLALKNCICLKIHLK